MLGAVIGKLMDRGPWMDRCVGLGNQRPTQSMRTLLPLKLSLVWPREFAGLMFKCFVVFTRHHGDCIEDDSMMMIEIESGRLCLCR